MVWALVAAIAGAYVSALIAWGQFNRADPALVIGNLLLALPVVLATVGALLASRRVRAPFWIAGGAVAVGAAAGLVAGLIPFTPPTTHGYLALTSAIAGAGLGLSVGLLVHDPPLMAMAALAGALGGALSGPLAPVGFSKSNFVAEVVLSTVFAAIPVLVLLAWRNRDATTR